MEDLPTEYDLIVLGTGMIESVIAAAAARVGKKVLHLDRRDYYSGEWATFNFEGLQRWIELQTNSSKPTECTEYTLNENETSFKLAQTFTEAMNVQQEWFIPEKEPDSDENTENAENGEVKSHDGWTQKQLKEKWRHFNIDLAPKLLFSRGSLVELLISSNIARYAEFKATTRVLTWLDGHIELVPCSRSDVFATKNISVVEKRMLMKLLTMCYDFESHKEDWEAYENKTFVTFLKSRRLTDNVIHYVLHSIAMVDETVSCREGLQAVRRFLSSLGRYGNTPFLWPLYGSGELPQCFCRMCAVYGGIYYLKRGIDSVIVDGNEQCCGVVSNGQRFSCSFLVAERSVVPVNIEDAKTPRGISRAVFVTDRSLMPAEKEQLTLLQMPPEDGHEPVRVIEVGASAMAAPSGLFIVHLTSRQRNTAREDLYPVAQKLLNFSSESQSQSKPAALWGLYFNQKDDYDAVLHVPKAKGVSFCGGPGLELDFENCISQANSVWEHMYPNEEFLPRAPDPEEIIFGDEHDEEKDEVGDGDAETTETSPNEADVNTEGSDEAKHNNDESLSEPVNDISNTDATPTSNADVHA